MPVTISDRWEETRVFPIGERRWITWGFAFGEPTGPIEHRQTLMVKLRTTWERTTTIQDDGTIVELVISVCHCARTKHPLARTVTETTHLPDGTSVTRRSEVVSTTCDRRRDEPMGTFPLVPYRRVA